jgi:hypothetical protein
MFGNTSFTMNIGLLDFVNLLKPSRYYTYHQVSHSNKHSAHTIYLRVFRVTPKTKRVFDSRLDQAQTVLKKVLIQGFLHSISALLLSPVSSIPPMPHTNTHTHTHTCNSP